MIDKCVLSVKASYLPVTKNLSERRERFEDFSEYWISKGNETPHLAGQLYQGQCEWETNDRNATQSWVSRLHDPLGTMLKPGFCKRTQAALGIPALWRFLQPRAQKSVWVSKADRQWVQPSFKSTWICLQGCCLKATGIPYTFLFNIDFKNNWSIGKVS